MISSLIGLQEVSELLGLTREGKAPPCLAVVVPARDGEEAHSEHDGDQ